MSQQRAVEWLVEQINQGKIEIIYSDRIHSIKCISSIVEQAKEMDREQTIEFAKNCLNKALDLDIRTAYSNVEQYYNETFKK